MEAVRSGPRREERPGARDLVPWSYPLVAFATLGLLLIAYLCQHAQAVRCEYDLVDLRGEQRLLLQEKAELELAIQELTSLERVERLATSRLKMIPPGSRLCLDLTAAQGAKPQVAAVGSKELQGR